MKNEELSVFDAIVVGSGAGGAAAASRLVRAGLHVLLVERGGVLPRDGTTLDVQKVVHDGAFKSRELWLDRRGRTFAPEEHFNVGGKTKWYGAALARFSAAEFAADDDHQCSAWPCRYAELAPYYDDVEALLGARRIEPEPDLAIIIERLRRRAPAWRAEPLPMGLDVRIGEHRQEAAHFDGFASPLGLKADAEQVFLAPLSDAPNFALWTGRAVTDLVGDPADACRIVGVRLEDGAQLSAPEVLLAAGALHSPRLVQRYLTRARLEHLPLADVAGRYFKLHLLTAVLALSPRRKADLIRKTTLLLHDGLPHSSVQPLGFDGDLISTLIPRYVPRHLAKLLGERAYGFFLQTEDGSSRYNRVLAAGDAEPYPLLDYDARRTPAAHAEHRRLVRTFCRDLTRAGYLAVAQGIGVAGTAHACGTLRAGSDPATSAVDAFGRVHGLDGLSVVDGSVLPRSSRVNPALTIYAWGLRAAEHIAGSRHATTLRAEAAARPAPAALAG